jgi:biopolymer transport protein ExbD
MSHYRHKTPEPGGVNLGLIITPMLDMSFQILSFFIMTYHPSALEGHIAGSLAPPEITAVKSKENITPDVIPPSVPEEMLLPEVQEAITVIIKAGGAAGDPGKPDKVLIKRKTEPAPVQVADATQKWDAAKADLSKELKRVKKEGGMEHGNIKIEADSDLRQEYVMDIYDVCKMSGFPKIHFVPPPLLRAPKD